MTGKLFNELRRLKLPREHFAIFGSGPLAIRGIIPLANDLDVLCRRDVWEFVRTIGTEVFLPDYDVTVVNLLDGAISFGTEWGIGDFSIDELISTAELIDGLPFARLEHVVRYKRLRCSDKDLLHLDALATSEYSEFLSVGARGGT